MDAYLFSREMVNILRDWRYTEKIERMRQIAHRNPGCIWVCKSVKHLANSPEGQAGSRRIVCVLIDAAEPCMPSGSAFFRLEM